MRNIFFAILVCGLAFGLGTTVYAFPTMGSDCASCHGGSGRTTPGCGGSSGCNRRISTENPTIRAAAPTEGPLATQTMEKDGFTLSFPGEMDSELHQVIVWKNKKLASKVASWGIVVVSPNEGQDGKKCAAFVNDLNNDPTGKFFDKLDVDSLINFTK